MVLLGRVTIAFVVAGVAFLQVVGKLQPPYVPVLFVGAAGGDFEFVDVSWYFWC